MGCVTDTDMGILWSGVCRRVFYCKVECQKGHWGFHKKECKFYQQTDKVRVGVRVSVCDECAHV